MLATILRHVGGRGGRGLADRRAACLPPWAMEDDDRAVIELKRRKRDDEDTEKMELPPDHADGDQEPPCAPRSI